ncbi:MAG: Rieske 2Fe-2S domain-containing protein [Thermoguttaceae bacterium]
MSTKQECCCCGDSGSKATAPRRRGFLAGAVALVTGGVACAVPAFAGLVSFLNPLRQKAQAGQFLRLASLETLPDDGTPRKFPVILDRTDAWNRFPNEPVGAVFLRRVPSKDKKVTVEAIHVVCPHAGCFIVYDATKNNFACPCHNGSFDLGGKRLDASSPSPRDLDTLEVELRNGTEVWVKFQNFRTGIPQKVAEA